MGDERDLVPGQRIVEHFMPFLLHLAESSVVKKTVKKHVGNLWILEGEIIRDLEETPKLRKKPVNEPIDTLLANDGPLIDHCATQNNNSDPSSPPAVKSGATLPDRFGESESTHRFPDEA
jgi:hypothetical protein